MTPLALGLAVGTRHTLRVRAPLEVTPASAILVGSQTAQLTAMMRDGADNSVPAAGVTYASRDPRVVSVSRSGLVRGIGTGSAFIVAASGPARDSALITVLVARLSLPGTPFGIATAGGRGAYVTQVGLEQVTRLDLPTQRAAVAIGVGAYPSNVASDSKGARAFVTNQRSQSISIINTATNTGVRFIPVTGDPWAVIVAPGDTVIYVSTNANKIYGISLTTAAANDSFDTGEAPANGFALRGSMLYASLPFAGLVQEIDIESHALRRTFPVGGKPQDLVIAPNGEELWIANEDGYVQFWSLETNAESGRVVLPGGGGFGMARNPATGHLYISTSYLGSQVHIVDPRARAYVRPLVTGGVPRRIAFTASGDGLIANEGGWIDFVR